MKVNLVTTTKSFQTGIERYAVSLAVAMSKIADVSVTKLQSRELSLFGRPVGGYASLILGSKNIERSPDRVVHVLAPMPFSLKEMDILTVHDMVSYKLLHLYQHKLPMAVGHALNIRSMLTAGTIIVPTVHTKAGVVDMLGRSEEDVFVVPEAVDIELFRIISDEKDWNSVLYVGDDNPRKNITSILEALALLDRKKMKLIWAGSGHWSEERKRIRQKARSLGVRLVELGRISDEELVRVYNKVALLVYPSFDEGFGLPLLEAAACGTFSVISEIAPFREVLRELGSFVNPYDVYSIAKGIETGLELSKTIDREMLREWASRFTWKKTAEQTLEVYKEVSGC